MGIPRTLTGALFPSNLSSQLSRHAVLHGTSTVSNIWLPLGVLRLLTPQAGVALRSNAPVFRVQPATLGQIDMKVLAGESVLVNAAHTTNPGFFTPERFLSEPLVPFDVNGAAIVGRDAVALIAAQKQHRYPLPFWVRKAALVDSAVPDRKFFSIGSSSIQGELIVKTFCTTPPGSRVGYYNVAQFDHPGMLTALDCHCYVPHTMFASLFPPSIARLMAQAAFASGWTSPLWLTLPQAKLFGAELETETGPEMWLSELTPGYLTRFYCASQFKRCDELLPTMHELELLAMGVAIPPAKMAGYPHIAKDVTVVRQWDAWSPTTQSAGSLVPTLISHPDLVRRSAKLSNFRAKYFVSGNAAAVSSSTLQSGQQLGVWCRHSKMPAGRLLFNVDMLENHESLSHALNSRFLHAGTNSYFMLSSAGQAIVKHALKHNFTSRSYFPEYFAHHCRLVLLPNAVPVLITYKLEIRGLQKKGASSDGNVTKAFFNAQQFTDQQLASKIANYRPKNFRGEVYRRIMCIEMKIAAATLNCLHEPMWISERLIHFYLKDKGEAATLCDGVDVKRDIARSSMLRFFNLSEFRNPQRVRELLGAINAAPVKALRKLEKRMAGGRRKSSVWDPATSAA